MTEPHLQLSDEDFRRQFENFDLPPSMITHEGHFRIVWVYLKDFDFETAFQKVNEGIKKYDKMVGDGTKYHATITYAYMMMIKKKMGEKNYVTWDEFVEDNKGLLKPVKEVLLNFYNPETLFSDRAKVEIIEPDLESF
jgi:hypothetical protein